MEPLVFVLVPGLLGGLLIAAALFLRGSGGASAVAPVRRDVEAVSVDVINASRIRVAGAGGLGLVAMAAAVAIEVPRIGETVAAGAACGALLALALIRRRRALGPLNSSRGGSGAKVILAIDRSSTGLAGHPDDRRDDASTLLGGATWPSHLIADSHRC
jgi:hypothetical protein